MQVDAGWPRYLLIFVTLSLLVQILLTKSVQGGQETEVTKVGGGLSGVSDLPIVQTTVVGFWLAGEKRTDFVQIGDLDILWISEEQRFLPLLRLCRELEIPFSEERTIIRLENPTGDSVVVDLFLHQIRVATQLFPMLFHVGRSDITGLREIYLPDSLVELCLDMTLQWDESGYLYRAKSQSLVPKLARLKAERAERRKRRRSTKNLTTQGISLPEIVPPATPEPLGDPSIATITPSLRVSGTTTGNLVVQRNLALWGRFMRGEYSARFRQSELEWQSYTRLDQAYWYREFGNVEMNLGDLTFGLNELVIPAASMTGVEINGLLGASADPQGRTSSQRGRYNRFGTRQDFRGYALLGSTVHLYRGDQQIAEQKVAETDDAPLGQGLYHFRGINLLRNERNEIRIVVIEPDSTIHEYTREIIGTDRLLQPGQLAFIGATGTRRLPDEQFWYTQGYFAGGRVSLGLLPSMTLGPVFAWQRDYAYTYPIRTSDDSRRSIRMQMPSESYHAGLEWTWRLFDRFVFHATGAGSRAEEDSLVRYAGRASLIFPLGPFFFQPQAFHYRPQYFSGISTRLEDREGYAVSLLWPFMQRSRLILATGQVEDDVEETRNSKTVVEWQRTDLLLSGILPGSRLLFAGERLAPRHLDAHYLWTAGGSMDLPLGFICSGSTTWGDEFPNDNRRELVENLGLTDAPRGRRIGWEVNLRRQLFSAGRLTITHSHQNYRRRTHFTHTLQTRGQSRFQWRLEGGYDWEPKNPYGQAQISYRLDRSGTVSIGTTVRYQRRDWIFGITLSLRPTFGFMDGKPFLLTKSRLNPETGGLKGQVFLDSNGNGLREPGERGIGGIEVIADSRRRLTTSKKGTFIMQPRGLGREVYVSLDPETIPAFYAATNGAQWAEVKRGALTRVGLGLIILNSITGTVSGPDPQDTTNTIGIRGVRVVARKATGEIIRKSITAGDGSYYLGELRSGDYQIDVDEQTLPVGYSVIERLESIRLQPDDEPIDMSHINIRCNYAPPPESEDKDKEVPEKKIEYKKF